MSDNIELNFWEVYLRTQWTDKGMGHNTATEYYTALKILLLFIRKYTQLHVVMFSERVQTETDRQFDTDFSDIEK